MKFDELSKDLQEKIKACKTPEELQKLAKEEGYELSEEQLASLSAGWSSPDVDNCPPIKPECKIYTTPPMV